MMHWLSRSRNLSRARAATRPPSSFFVGDLLQDYGSKVGGKPERWVPYVLKRTDAQGTVTYFTPKLYQLSHIPPERPIPGTPPDGMLCASYVGSFLVGQSAMKWPGCLQRWHT